MFFSYFFFSSEGFALSEAITEERPPHLSYFQVLYLARRSQRGGRSERPPRLPSLIKI